MTFVGQSNSSYETKQIVLKYVTFIIWEAQFALDGNCLEKSLKIPKV